MKQIKDRRSLARWFAAATAVLMVATLPLLATPAHADTVRSLSWHLDTLRIARAQQITKGAGVTVVVVDSGVQANNQDLVGQVVAGKGFAPGTAGDGRTDPDQQVSHGTGMASLIAGRGGGQQRMLGIAPQARIMPVAVGDDTRTMTEAIRWAADQKPGVISISMGTTSPLESAELDDAITYAQQHDVVVVASAGNEGTDLRQLARHPGVVSVGAVDRKGGVWENSSRGPELAVAAPGVDVIMSVNTGNGYGVGSGTSQSAAITSGVVALIRAEFPDLDAANVVNRLIKTAIDKGDKGRDSLYGFGIIDPVRALTADVPRVDANPLGAAAPLPDDTARGRSADESGDGGSGLGIRFTNPVGLLVYGLGCLAVVAAIVVLIVWSNRRRRRGALPGAPAGQRPGPPWAGPPPTGYGQQGHYPPPPQQPNYGPPPQQPVYGPPPPQPTYGPPSQQPGQPGQPPDAQRQPPLSGER
ncbi:S8 family serine peptidase [Asanoa iriomotensis]|uniref:Peptidase S8/S53 domain-containing protein n=1 Tax=Asanoa iriomotensis TaxID=234613 RepID=A0ABQ4CG02_9ACTN|nr:S8 family serine peptidase [Asanoa iriomotensis]GIF61240.1 hypothetical protein Air01nite_73350 [Asanoa iriomotensis]